MKIITCGLSALLPFLLLIPQLHAGPPTYRILRTPAAYEKHLHAHGYHPGTPHYVWTNAYAYGWFGVHSRFHKVKHHGWRRNYTQWKYR